MCGIAGLIRPPADWLTTIIEMVASLEHRGPDDEGFVAHDDTTRGGVPFHRSDSTSRAGLARLDALRPVAVLGHRRLAILDPSPSGHQPMQSHDGAWIVFNGEIYNYLELRDDLAGCGVRFRTGTDTEVLLAAWDRWGTAAFGRLNGDFALAIVDPTRRRVVLSRDRFGVKPLYLAATAGGGIAFASEIKALFSVPGVDVGVDEDAVDDFAGLSLLDVDDRTLFRGIRQLEPAHWTEIDLASGSQRTERYYRPTVNHEIGKYNDRKCRQAAAQVRELLVDAVRLRLRSDVPVGACLSGGLDSSSVVAIAAGLRRDAGAPPLETFTASFPGTRIDETQYAQRVVQHVGAHNHLVRPTEAEFRDSIYQLLLQHDEPFQGPGVFSQWCVMRLASRHVTVTLDGQGGDEVFAGYRNYRVALVAELLRSGRALTAASEAIATARRAGGLSAAVRELRAVPVVALPERLRASVLRRRMPVTSPRGRRARAQMFAPRLGDLLGFYLSGSSLPHLLKYADRNSMAHSVEARLPFVDHRLVDLAGGLPGCFKIHDGYTKWILRLAVEDLLPPEIVWRTDKLGFATPAWSSRAEHQAIWRTQIGGRRDA